MSTTTLLYSHLTPEQKLRVYWLAFCDADPVPTEFADDMEAAGLITWRIATKADAQRTTFAEELGIEKGRPIYVLTDAGREIVNGKRSDNEQA